MARGHGRISSSIWEDSDFLALTQQQQRLYLFLISQPNLNHAGLLPLTLRRWARKSKGLTARELEDHLDSLAVQQFIVLDEDTEELLIRTFVRNDGVWRMPKVMGAMVSGAMEIESHALRRALVAEMDRIPLDQLSDEPTKARSGEGPSVRAQVSEHIAALRKAFAHVTSGPTETPSATPSATPSQTPSQPPTEEGAEGSTRAHAGASRAHSPAPAPAPNPSPGEEDSSAPADAGHGSLDGDLLFDANGEAPAPREDNSDFGAFWLVYPKRRDKQDALKAWTAAIKAGADPQRMITRATEYARERAGQDPKFTKYPATWIRKGCYENEPEPERPHLQAVSGGWQPWSNPEDQSVYLNGW